MKMLCDTEKAPDRECSLCLVYSLEGLEVAFVCPQNWQKTNPLLPLALFLSLSAEGICSTAEEASNNNE